MSTSAHAGRRDFLISTGAVTALASAASQGMAAVPTSACGVALSAADNVCLKDVALDDFAPLLGQAFRAYAPGHAAMLTLIDASALPALGTQRPQHARSTPFSLVFRGDLGAGLESGIHEIEHEKLGNLKLLVNPIGDHTSVQSKNYEVVFG